MDPESVPLDRPGAGLPFPEAAFTRWILFPVFCTFNNWEDAQSKFQAEGRKIIQLVEALDEETLLKRVLIRRVLGIEDSSRFWSPAMVLEHLILVGKLMQTVIVCLNEGKTPLVKADTAAVKPNVVTDRDVIASYRIFIDQYRQALNVSPKNQNSNIRFKHPWFGALNVHEWACVSALHQAVHRKQLLEILKRSP